MSLTPGSALGPYRITAQLGHGGMGVVYTAHDPRLQRQVAIKLLTADLTRDETAKQRFLQEAQAASALDHPNICTIHEINETPDGQLYLVMAYYEGETLKQRIERGPLVLDEAIDIATQVGIGLAEAHGAGILHRDIKPANLLIAKGGVVKILDFGLAKLVGAEGVTQTGTTVGTVAYMSPEQARGEEVDHRTDIWSLGVVLYEMLAGRAPFQGENLLSISNAIMEKELASLPGPSSSAQSAVSRALSKNRGQRYQAVNDLLGELRKLQGSPTVVGPAQPDMPSIAVLPFADMSPGKDQDYFCEGMAEEILNALTSLEGLHVAARTSSFQFKGQYLNVAKIGRELNVGAILEGSVRKAGNRLRITAQLINVNDGFHLWSERYDRDMDDVFAVQDDIARTVVDKLKVQLLGVINAPLVKRPTDNLEAYNLYLQGRYYRMRLTGEPLEKGLACFTRAAALEPSYAHAHAGVAYVQAARSALSLVGPPHAVMPEAKQSALKALALDETVGDAHAALAYVLHYYEWDWAGAEHEYRRALALNADDATARSHYAFLLGQQGRADESVTEARSAVESDPVSPLTRLTLVVMFVTARRFDTAVVEAQAAIIETDPNSYSHIGLGFGFAGLGSYEEAVESFRQATNLGPGDPIPQSYLGWALGLAGRQQEALTILDDLERRRSQEYVGGVLLAWASLGLGDNDQAISWLQQAADERDGQMAFLNTWFLFDPLRSDPRFQALLRRMNFPGTAAPTS